MAHVEVTAQWLPRANTSFMLVFKTNSCKGNKLILPYLSYHLFAFLISIFNIFREQLVFTKEPHCNITLLSTWAWNCVTLYSTVPYTHTKLHVRIIYKVRQKQKEIIIVDKQYYTRTYEYKSTAWAWFCIQLNLVAFCFLCALLLLFMPPPRHYLKITLLPLFIYH